MNTVLLFLILVKLSLQLNKKETQKLFEWGKSKNVKFHPSVSLQSSDKEHPFPYFTTNTTLSRDDLIIQIPYSVILTVDNIIKYSKSNKIRTIYNALQNNTNEYIKINSTKEMILISLVMQQYKHLLNKNSTLYKRFKNYFHIYKDHSLDNFPVFYSKEELAFLTQSSFASQIQSAKESLDTEVKIMENDIQTTHFFPDEFIKYRVMTLAHSLLINRTLMYIPFIECFPKSNSNPNVKWLYNEITNTLEIIAIKQIEKGEILKLHYRKIPNAMNLLYYGYTEEDNSLNSRYLINIINNLFYKDMNMSKYIYGSDLKVFDISKETFETDIIETYNQIAMRHPSYKEYIKSGGYRLMRDNLVYYAPIYDKFTPGEINKHLYSDIKARDIKRVISLEKKLIENRIDYLNNKIQLIESENINENIIIDDDNKDDL